MTSPAIVIATPHGRNDVLEQRVRDRLPDYRVVRLRSRQDMSFETLEQIKPDFVFVPHWSWLIPEKIHSRFDCVIFHMTNLPYGRGGSPLQNLIVRGHQETMLTALKCVSELDAGAVYLKRPLSLAGTAEEILHRASTLMEEMIIEIVESRPMPVPQQGEAIEFKRRRSADGDMAPLEKLEQVYDFIRMLDADGYPPAFIDIGRLHLEFSQANLSEEFVEAKVRIKRKPITNSIAVIAAHPDDEVLGCGGTLARMALEGRAVHILLMADGETSRAGDVSPSIDPARLAARNAAADQACKILGCTSVEVLALPDNRLDGMELLDVVKRLEIFLELYQPSTVLTHYRGDVNIDHRVVHDAVIAACRPQPSYSVKELLFFEVPSSTEWRPPCSVGSFNPNWFVDISTTLAKKLEALHAYESELRAFPHPRSLKAVNALAQWRGATVGVEAAEAFVLGRKLIG